MIFFLNFHTNTKCISGAAKQTFEAFANLFTGCRGPRWQKCVHFWNSSTTKQDLDTERRFMLLLWSIPIQKTSKQLEFFFCEVTKSPRCILMSVYTSVVNKSARVIKRSGHNPAHKRLNYDEKATFSTVCGHANAQKFIIKAPAGVQSCELFDLIPAYKKATLIPRFIPRRWDCVGASGK